MPSLHNLYYPQATSSSNADGKDEKAGEGDFFANGGDQYALSETEKSEGSPAEALVRVDTKIVEEDRDAPVDTAVEEMGHQHPFDRAEKNQNPANVAGLHLLQTAQHMARGEFPLDAGLVMEILEGNVEIDFSVKVDGKTAQEWFDEIAETEENEEVLAEMKMAVGNPPVAHASACSVGFAGCTRSRRVSFWSPPAEQK